jgi:hypothetical protein
MQSFRMGHQRRKPRPPAILAAIAFAVCLLGVLLFWVESMRHNLTVIGAGITVGKFSLWLASAVAAGLAIFGWKRGEGGFATAAFLTAVVAVVLLSWL